jgi:formylmethanofuran dehydrogenase subunit E
MKIIKTAKYIRALKEWELKCNVCGKTQNEQDFASFDPNICKGCAEKEQMEQAAYKNEKPGGSHDMYGDSF